jgi:hypothetical protein
VDNKARGEVLADLGDWYLIQSQTRRSYENYAEAWKSLTQAGDTHYLERPRILAYRPSISSVDRSQLEPTEAEVKAVELHMTVDRDGRIDNVTSPTTDVPDSIVKNSIASMRRSRFAPRIENGVAVASDNVVFVERVLVRIAKPADDSSSSGKAAEEKPADSPESKPEEKKPDPK